jgi:hypothetical protein
MPAIDLARLRRQVDGLGALSTDLPQLQAQILELFEFYRDRTRRPTAAARAADPGRRSLGVPRPVLRALARGLDEALPPSTEVRLTLADQLWGTALAESQYLAARLVGTVTGAGAADWVAGCAAGTESRAALKQLAGEALSSLRSDAAAELFVAIERWMRSENPRLRALAYFASAPLVEADGFQGIPDLLGLLESTLKDAGGFAQPALQELVEALARRVPPEAARMLIDELGRAIPGIDQLVRLCAPAFPVFQRGRLERALSALRRTGIIPPS